MKLVDALEDFLLSKESANCSESTLDFYRRNVIVFIQYLQEEGVTGTDWCNAGTIERFLAKERRKKLSPHTVNARYRALRAFFNWLQSRYKIPSPLADVVEPELPDKAPRQITLAEVEKLVDSIPQDDWWDLRDRLILVLFFWSGIRLGEMARLHVKDVNVKEQLIHVRRGKGGKDRFVPFAEQVGPLVLKYLMARPPYDGPELILSNDGGGGVRGPIAGDGIRQMLKRRCKEAGVEYHNPHAFRHGFAMAMLNDGGMEMGVLSKLLGHSSTAVTQAIYADWVTESLRREYKQAQESVRSRRSKRSKS